jgi:hypothetical protein
MLELTKEDNVKLIPKVNYIEHQRSEEQIDHNIFSVLLRFTNSD